MIQPEELTMKNTALLATLAVSASLLATAVQAETRLKVADSFPTSHYISVEAAKKFMDEATRLSNGELQFDYFPTEQLGKAKDLLQLTTTGLTDIAYIVPSYAPDKLPMSSVAELPGMYSTSCEGTHAFWKLIDEGGILNREEFEPNGVVPLMGFALPPYQISVTAKPLDGIDALKGQKIRAAGGAFELTLRALEAVPVRMAAPEIREALVRGTIDGSVGPLVSLAPYDLLTVMRHGTQKASFGGFVGTYSISKEVWDGLSQEQQAALKEAGRSTMEHFCTYADDNEAAGAKAFEEAGGTLWPYSAEQNAELAERVQPVADDWATRLEERGLPARQVLDAYKAARASN